MIATRHNKLGRGTGFGIGDAGDPAYTVTAAHGHAVCAGFKYHQGSGAGSMGYESEQSPILTADWHNPAICIQGDIARGAHMGQNGRGYSTDGACYTLNTIDRHAVLCMAGDTAHAAVDRDLAGLCPQERSYPNDYICNQDALRQTRGGAKGRSYRRR